MLRVAESLKENNNCQVPHSPNLVTHAAGLGILVFRPRFAPGVSVRSSPPLPAEPPERWLWSWSRCPREPSSLARKQFVVESVELVYYVPQSPSVEPIVQPVWIFEGHNAAGTIHFVAHVQAVTEEHLK